ncbi:MAG: sigma-70 family RNA polymerase sigma factor [Pyrinomonadaceae bacterium]|nr:sigma-70 family RNA polymerase sigma factor [Pyrinomonadaceae bacterium]MCX7638829.1 sigma-70 family RNA polymerase sigma factor [Pyrinomonadaceae bacterium]MDW8305035.1 sigma-70 family RNA polymerase sigma factor [Acidobacteriota bacterium]
MATAKVISSFEDEELVRRCRAGDVSAWELIVATYSKRIFNLAYRFTFDVEAAEDLTQEVFVKIYKTLDQYNSNQGDLSNWLMKIARNLIIDDYRRRQRMPQDSDAENIEDHIFHLRSIQESQQIEIERQELMEQIQKAIKKLPPDMRICVILRDVEELSYQEIAKLLKVPEGTVKSRINRGRIELAKILRRMRVVNI